uniref:Uncharacterized protein n=1 Tax=Panagrolaimus sp. ES5 TaxID=591445 RepID=A0AC34FLR2_9BILA
VDVRPKIINGKIIWSGGPSLKQQFSLPHSIMYYMAKNPSTSTSYLKLIQSCKYFFEKNPIIVVNTMGEIHLCSNDEYACEENENKCCVYPDYFAIPKFWIIHDLQLYNNAVHIPDFTSFLRPKLFRSEVLFLTIVDKTVYFDDFVLLAGCAKLVDLRSVEMIHEDGSVVMLEEIIDVIPNVVDFY